MSVTGYTKARSMGPVAEAVERAGGSIGRVFRRAELPTRLVERPDHLILLRDQLSLVECATREVGDEVLPLRLSLEGGIASLGPFGRHVFAAPTFELAIERCNRGIGAMLQSATRMNLTRARGYAIWSYEITDPARVGRQKNELLAFGYMTDLMRRFLGPSVSPLRVELGGELSERATIQDLLRCEVSRGERASLIFREDMLRAENTVTMADVDQGIVDVPDPSDLAAGVEHLIKLGLLDRRPTIEWVSRRLRISQRTLQRRLRSTEQDFESIRRRVLVDAAALLLKSPDLSMSEIAYELGYSDPSHFTRAVFRWTGQTPRDWRQAMRKTAEP